MRAVVVGRCEVQHWVADNGQPRMSKRILSDAVGPDLRWATVVVERIRAGKNASERAGATDEESF
jgi:hypothetical protein